MSTLVSKVSSLFAGRVQSVVLIDGTTIEMSSKVAGRTLIAFRDALKSGSDVYAFSGKLLDLQQSGEFTVRESKVVEDIRQELLSMAKKGVVFTADRAPVSAGAIESAALRTIAKTVKATGVSPAKATRRRSAK
jgi:hypothetical protein